MFECSWMMQTSEAFVYRCISSRWESHRRSELRRPAVCRELCQSILMERWLKGKMWWGKVNKQHRWLQPPGLRTLRSFLWGGLWFKLTIMSACTRMSSHRQYGRMQCTLISQLVQLNGQKVDGGTLDTSHSQWSPYWLHRGRGIMVDSCNHWITVKRLWHTISYLVKACLC